MHVGALLLAQNLDPHPKTKLEITVIDYLGNYLPGATVTIYEKEESYMNEKNPARKNKKTDSSGKVFFDYLKPINYYVDVLKSQASNRGLGVMTDPLERKKLNKVRIVVKGNTDEPKVISTPQKRSPPKIPPETVTELKYYGTAFAMDDKGHIITNYHVVKDAISIKVLITNHSKKFVYADIVAKDISIDLAILRINDVEFQGVAPPYNFYQGQSRVGENVYTLGYPLKNSMGEEVKLTTGVISSKSGYQGDISSYQISVPIQPGNSGGPLINRDGEIIGIVSAVHLHAQNASYAIKSIYLSLLIDSVNKLELNKTNSLKGLELPDQVDQIKNFIYSIEVTVRKQ